MKIFLTALLFFPFFIFAFTPDEIIGKPITNEYKKFKFQFQLDFRNSFLGKNIVPVQVYGVNCGILHNQKFRYGLGVYLIDETSNKELGFSHLGRQIKVENGEFAFTPTYFANRNLFLMYGTLNFTYILLNNKYVILGFPVELGFGGYSYQLDNIKVNSELSTKEKEIAETRLNQPATQSILNRKI